ncbi:hypothetical protein NLJ89_g5038 [Agrocybe chaxingu]|uniref:pyranose dehydrogenase (acceptor) n=1 Tax=Agrocybe chaxingu TaxID=84603 RepID=A0A9W8MTZ8_9AGAR|nr:hypothetical protein NLJ89_g5038 [Agrocybe chaxingu]
MAQLTSRLLGFIQLLAVLGAAHGYIGMVEELQARQINPGQLAAAYDYIVVGGGQSGLAIANRLSEDTGRSVLIVEYGYINDNPGQLDPSSATAYPPANMFNISSVPQPALGNRQQQILAASVVGGGNPGWSWDGLLPYFKKATTLNPPRADLAAEFNITYDIDRAYGNGPIHGTFPDFLWPGMKVQWNAWKDLGIQINYEGAAGDAYGAYWTPSATDTQYRRSYARTRYFEPVSTRQNLKLLVGHRVNEVLFNADKRAEAVTIQQRGTPNGATTITVKATQEIILTSGWLHTPQILQRSGIGPSALLQQAGINVLVDLPGVGSNHQEHPYFFGQFSYQTDVTPNPSSLFADAQFRNWADQQWQQRKGPRSIGVGNGLATVPLPDLSTRYQAIIDKAKAQNAATYLPRTYTPEQIQGFTAQRDVMLASFGKRDNGVVEIPFSGSAGNILVLMKPLSRGTVLLNTADRYAEPIVDFNANVNPVDVDIMADMLRFYRRWMQTPSMRQLTPAEQSPGAGVSSDQQISNYLATTVATHTCATVYAIAEKASDLIKARYDPTIPSPPNTPGTTQPGSPPPTTSNPQPTQPPSCAVPKWGQCGGQGYSGCTTCESGSTCSISNTWYSQCL